MSFDLLKKSDFARKSKEISVKIGDAEVKFYANEINYLQRLNLAAVQSQGGDPFTNLVILSITDQDGKKMTQEQAESLPPEIALKFFEAAAEVNNQENPEKN